MPTLKNMADLEKYLKAKINKSLQKEVFKKVKEVEQKNIDETVYDSYTPSVYMRRDIQGGLIAGENIIGTVDSKTSTLSVINKTPANSEARDGATTDKNLSELIEFGHGYKNYGYDYGRESAFVYPRPFTQNTIEELEQKKQHIQAMKDGLKKQGLDAK